MDEVITFKLKVIGRVQGVAFRYYTKLKADELGLKGWVMNESDLSVSIKVAGKRQLVMEFIKWCHKGSPASTVSELHFSEIDYFAFENFEIKR